MFKKTLVGLLSLSLLFAPGCATVQSAREKLETMSQEDFNDLNLKVFQVTADATHDLAQKIQNKPELVAALKEVAKQLEVAVQTNALPTTDIVKFVLSQFGEKMGSPYIEYIQIGTDVLDAAIGEIKLGLENQLSARERALIMSLLDGVQVGLS